MNPRLGTNSQAATGCKALTCCLTHPRPRWWLHVLLEIALSICQVVCSFPRGIECAPLFVLWHLGVHTSTLVISVLIR